MAPQGSSSERGVALITTLLVLMLVSSLLVGFTAVVVSDQQNRGIDEDRTQAFYAAQGGLEKLTADLGNLFSTDVAPSQAQIDGVMNNPPVLPGVTYQAAGGGSGYTITYTADANGNPVSQNRTILSGPYQGLIGLITPYQMDVTARTVRGSEVHLTRTLQTVAIPVFQFGTFSDTDLSFFAGPSFNFGGRVHTNGNLFLAEGNGNTLTLSDNVTAVGEVIRTNLSNGWPTSSNYTGTVNVLTSPGAYRALKTTEGSLVGTLGSALNEPTWTNLSLGTYNGNIRNGRTGATTLNLPLITVGGQTTDLIRRPASSTENVTNPTLFQQRYFSMASLRILLSDNPNDITSLPTVTQTPPVSLGNLALNPISGYTVDANHPPLAISSGVTTDGYRSPAGTPLLGGYLKIEKQDVNGVWSDVTADILSLGIAGKNLSNGACTDPNPDAVLRFERLRDVPSTAPGNACGNGSTVATDYWPDLLFDPREGDLRDSNSTSSKNVYLGGVMGYVELDVRNLSRWFEGQIGTEGTNAMNQTGYVVYFSDRRNNHDASGNETGEYGFEDFVNPASPSGTPNGILDPGEDVNGNGVLDTYGEVPTVPPGGMSPLDATATPWTAVTPQIAEVNSPIFFRRALKVTDGALGNIIAPGLTIAAENPVYLQGDWNAAGSFGNPHVATSIIADALTLLSNAWNDEKSFASPQNPSGRQASTTWYRLAVIAGKGMSFPQPTWGAAQDFGTDGGVHNFLRYIESWSGQTLNYRGAMASFFYSQQAVGTYKCCNNVYSPPTRAYNFDTDFLTPSLLPPRTPVFRDVNVLGFTQVIAPGK
ncbi:MAG TPA: hypothetical protein VNE16_15475 [Vicinamibacterales bacterium]|nr:hypothetical protein [Vicinamibacterales bacterium]